MSIEGLLGQQGEVFKRLLKESLQEVLEAEMTEVVGAQPSERTAERSGYRSGWLEDNRYINMDLLKEQKKAAMKIAA